MSLRQDLKGCELASRKRKNTDAPGNSKLVRKSERLHEDRNDLTYLKNNTDDMLPCFVSRNADVTLEVVSRKQDNSCQTVFNKFMLRAKTETLILRNIVATSKHSDVDLKSSNMYMHKILLDKKQTNFFIGLFPGEFDVLYSFLGPAKYELRYWKSRDKPLTENGNY